MKSENIPVALDTKFQSLDMGEVTARDYLKALLRTLLDEGESFSGKRPFGNSGWEHELAKPLIISHAIDGHIEEEFYGCPDDEQDYRDALDAMVTAL